MGLTSDKLRELTKRKLELIREIDKSPSNEALKENLRLIEEEISRERAVVVYGRPEEISTEQKAEDKKESAPDKRIIPKRDIAVSKTKSRSSKEGKEKSLKDFF